MAAIPQTSVSLLEALSGDATSVRWTEFVNKYSGPMRAFLQARYPAVEAEDVIQETFIALVKCLPRYRYVPDEHGYFHNYLIGIVDHKAKDALRRQAASAPSSVGRREFARSSPSFSSFDFRAVCAACRRHASSALCLAMPIR